MSSKCQASHPGLGKLIEQLPEEEAEKDTLGDVEDFIHYESLKPKRQRSLETEMICREEL